MTTTHIDLEDMLSDASDHLRDQGMLALSGAVDIARSRLAGSDDTDSVSSLRAVESSDSQLTLPTVQ